MAGVPYFYTPRPELSLIPPHAVPLLSLPPSSNGSTRG